MRVTLIKPILAHGNDYAVGEEMEIIRVLDGYFIGVALSDLSKGLVREFAVLPDEVTLHQPPAYLM